MELSASVAAAVVIVAVELSVSVAAAAAVVVCGSIVVEPPASVGAVLSDSIAPMPSDVVAATAVVELSTGCICACHTACIAI